MIGRFYKDFISGEHMYDVDLKDDKIGRGDSIVIDNGKSFEAIEVGAVEYIKDYCNIYVKQHIMYPAQYYSKTNSGYKVINKE